MILACQSQSVSAASRHKNFKALIARKVEQHTRVVLIIFHDQ